MSILAILGAQAALILGLDLYFDSRLCLWLLYFLPLLGTTRAPGVRITVLFAIALATLMLAGGLTKIGQAPWHFIFVPRALAVYPLALTAVLIVRGKQFTENVRDILADVAVQTQNPEGKESQGQENETLVKE
jgi:hypothetical protein